MTTITIKTSPRDPNNVPAIGFMGENGIFVPVSRDNPLPVFFAENPTNASTNASKHIGASFLFSLGRKNDYLVPQDLEYTEYNKDVYRVIGDAGEEKIRALSGVYAIRVKLDAENRDTPVKNKPYGGNDMKFYRDIEGNYIGERTVAYDDSEENTQLFSYFMNVGEFTGGSVEIIKIA